jgi:hypothetical protein
MLTRMNWKKILFGSSSFVLCRVKFNIRIRGGRNMKFHSLLIIFASAAINLLVFSILPFFYPIQWSTSSGNS